MKKTQVMVKMTLMTLIALALVISGCGSSGGSSSNSSKETDLKIMWWGSDMRHEATNNVLELYTSKNPNITFTPEFTSWDVFWSKLPTLAASKTIPDVLQMDAAYIQSYVSRGILADLSDLDLKGIVDDQVIENVKINGKLYGVPLSYNGQAMVYDKPTLEQYGITLPKNNWTWEEYFDFAREAGDKLPEGKYAVDDARNVWEFYQHYQTSKGLGAIFKDGTTFNLDKDSWFEFNEIYADFQAKGIVPPADLQLSAKENDPQTDTFATEKVVLRTSSVGSASAVEALLPGGRIAVNSYPMGPAGGGWAQSTIYFAINADSKNIEEAKAFLKWFISDQEAGNILGTTRGIPINADILAAVEPNLSAGEKLGLELLEVAKEKALPFYPAPSGAEDFIATYKAELEAVMFKQITLEQAYETIVEKGKAVEASLKQ